MRVAVAMSGGVDSSVVAKILKNEGHDLVGLFLKLWSASASLGRDGSDTTSGASCRKENRCCDYEALEDARMVAAKLGIPFYVIDAKAEFKKEVVDYFLKEYKNLRTPNPCIVCNETIKFDLLLKKALAIGCDFLATGHYARITQKLKLKSQNCDSKVKIEFKLLKGKDETKDQSYMLYRLNQEQLSKVLFPIGEMKKKDVRDLAIKWNLPVKEKPESQEICFFADRDYRTFLRRYLDKKYFLPGDIVDIKGNKIGKHDGLLNYTIGQRKLVNQLSAASYQLLGRDKKPLYVTGFDKTKNQLIVGNDSEVYEKEMIVSDLHWIDPKASSRQLKASSLSVKIRYHHPDVPSVIARSDATWQSDKLKVLFKKPQRAVTPGQSAVFYCGDEVIGGGVIEA